MRRPLALFFGALFAFALVVSSSFLTVSPASAASIASTTTCSNGRDNVGGKGLICRVTIVNTIRASGGSARITVQECHGSAGDPKALCRTTTRLLGRPVTSVRQCNGSINGGGGTLRCSVRVTNDFIGMSPNSTAATVNQCVGSGSSITKGCDPFPANTTGATITQCNGTANGGTLVGMICTATGTKSSAASVRINQCNGSGNGGGALVICSANITNRVVSAPSTSTNAVDRPTTEQNGSGPAALVGLLFLAALWLSRGYIERRALSNAQPR